MTPASTTNLLRWLFVIFCGSIGASAGESVLDSPWRGAAGGVICGLSVILLDRLLKGISLRAFSSATIGLFLGFIMASLINSAGVLRYQPEQIQWSVELVAYVVFGYLGMMLAMRSNRDEFSLIIPYVRFSEQSEHGRPSVVDTNIIIGGKLPDVCATGFLSGSFLVPEFVVQELQRLGDSSDPLKRERGRRGLDHLNALRRDPKIEITLVDGVLEAAQTVDQALIGSAKRMGASLLTDDANLAKVARLQGVGVLSFHELSVAMRPRLSAGDELELALVKEGRDPHQAVGFLSDGSMIVVNQGRKLMGTTQYVVISGHLQTSAGRLLFADLKEQPKRAGSTLESVSGGDDRNLPTG